MVIEQTIKKGYKETEVGLIPSDWEVKRFGEITTVRKEKYDSRKSGAHSFCVELEHIGQGTGSLIGFTETTDISSLKNVFKEDDVLFGRLRAYLRKYWKANRNGVASSEIWPLIANKDILIPEYLFQLVQTRSFIQSATEAYGTHMPRSDWSIIKKRFIPLPHSKSEQTAIATILSDTDALIEHLEKLIAKKKAIKQGTMQQLLTGKKRLPGFIREWEMKKLGEIGETYGGLSGKTKNDFNEGKFPYIPFMNIMSNPVIDLEYFDYVNIRVDEKQNKATKGDLFFNGSSETPEEVGMCSILQNDIPNLYLNSFCFGFRLNKDLKTNGLYLSYFFRSPIGRQLIFSLAQGATRYNLSKTNFMNLEIPYPEPSEQAAIVSILSDMDTETEKLESQLAKYKNIKQGIMQQVLTGKIRIYASN